MTPAPQVLLLELLVRAVRARRVLEIGTFTGLATLSMARAVGNGGEVTTIDNEMVGSEPLALARWAFSVSSHGERIKSLLIDARDYLRTTDRCFEFIYIDADKPSYRAYFDCILDRGLLAPHGLLCVDNTLWGGTAIAPPDDPTDWQEAWATDVARFNRQVAEDPRVVQVMLTINDGLTIIGHAAASPSTDQSL